MIKNVGEKEVSQGYKRIHYHRFDGQYQDWKLFVWGSSYQGDELKWEESLEFDAKTDYGVYWDISCQENGELNFVIHNGEEFDPQLERKLPITVIGNDIAEKLRANKNPDFTLAFPQLKENEQIWLLSNKGLYQTRVEAEAAAQSNELLWARAMSKNTIIAQFKKEVATSKAIKVINIEINNRLEIAKLEQLAYAKYKITLAKEADYQNKHKIAAQEASGEIIPDPESIDKAYTYQGELGIDYTPERTIFRLWAPVAKKVQLLLFDSAQQSQTPEQTIEMKREDNGLWQLEITKDLAGKFYQYQVSNAGKTKKVLDPYAKAMAAFDHDYNTAGKAAIVDLDKTNPKGWLDKSPIKIDNSVDACIYEMSVRDFTSSAQSGVKKELRGTYLGFIEKIPHLKELGVTHVQLLPIMKFYRSNEFKQSFEAKGSLGRSNYNWGYDPHNYFTPSGWYATDPKQPALRIKEVKKLIQALHQAGIGVVLDVVFNHTWDINIFEDVVPNYYYRRIKKTGELAKGSGCGNETASERNMMRKLMIDSAIYWAKEYNVDGYRFDLMGLHDEETMLKLQKEVKKINPDALIYGEGWDMGDVLSKEDRYIKGAENPDWKNYSSPLKYPTGPAVFDDTIRDALKQDSAVGPDEAGGFIQGVKEKKAELKAGIIAGLNDFNSQASISKEPYDRYTSQPQGALSYVSIHDGYTLWDKLAISVPELSKKERQRMHKLAGAIIYTAQGMTIMHGGMELLRTKPDPNSEQNPYVDFAEHGFDKNSYNSGDLTNQLLWDRKEDYQDIFNYFQGLIKLRQHYEGFRMRHATDIKKSLEFIPAADKKDNLVAYRISYKDNDWQEVIVIFNAACKKQTLRIEDVGPSWQLVLDAKCAGITELRNAEVKIQPGKITIPAISPIIICR